jgi:hypothetical protein
MKLDIHYHFDYSYLNKNVTVSSIFINSLPISELTALVK